MVSSSASHSDPTNYAVADELWLNFVTGKIFNCEKNVNKACETSSVY